MTDEKDDERDDEIAQRAMEDDAVRELVHFIVGRVKRDAAGYTARKICRMDFAVDEEAWNEQVRECTGGGVSTSWDLPPHMWNAIVGAVTTAVIAAPFPIKVLSVKRGEPSRDLADIAARHDDPGDGLDGGGLGTGGR